MCENQIYDERGKFLPITVAHTHKAYKRICGELRLRLRGEGAFFHFFLWICCGETSTTNCEY